MSWLSDFFSGGKNPADAAMPYLNQIPGMAKGYYEPYINKGNEAYNTFNPEINQMTSDPAAFLEKIMKGYEPSRGYQLQRDEALKAAGNSAAAGGMRGSSNDISNEARISDALQGEDMQKWIQNVLGIQKQGQTSEENLYNTGYNASNALSGDLSNVLGTQASLAFQGQANQNQSKGDLLSGLVKALGAVGGWSLPGKSGWDSSGGWNSSGGGTVGGSVLSRFI
jgi:hypothetical protein